MEAVVSMELLDMYAEKHREEMRNAISEIQETDNFFRIDEEGDIMPNDNPTISNIWELDSDGDIMPREV